jgi:hypothetical protein
MRSIRISICLFLLCCCGCISAQNVGIGISTPQSKLHVKPNTAAALQIDPYGNAAGQTGDLRLLELAPNGVNYAGFKAANAIPNNVVWVLPPADGAGTQVLSTDGAGNLYWQTMPASGSTTTVPGHCYTCDGF